MHHLDYEKTIRLIADTTKCNIVVVEDDKLLQSVLKIADDLPYLKAIIQYRGHPKDGQKDRTIYSENLFRKVYSVSNFLKVHLLTKIKYLEPHF